MTRSVDEIAAAFDALTAHDFDYANAHADGWERLDELCDELRAVNDPAACAPILFRIMERLDGVELGTPGPTVHTLESWPRDGSGFVTTVATSPSRELVSGESGATTTRSSRARDAE